MVVRMQIHADELSYNGLAFNQFHVARSAAYISQVTPSSSAGYLAWARGGGGGTAAEHASMGPGETQVCTMVERCGSKQQISLPPSS